MIPEVQERWSFVEGTHKMRTELLDALSDADLAFSPGGQNPPLGALCREMGEIEHSYVQSLKTFKQDWSYRNTEPGIENSVDKLRAWYQAMDDEFLAIAEGLSAEDLNKTIDRGFEIPVSFQIDVYIQALLIFFGKVTVYLRAMNRPLPQTIQQWIG